MGVRSRFLGGLALSFALVLSGCGSDGGTDAGGDTGLDTGVAEETGSDARALDLPVLDPGVDAGGDTAEADSDLGPGSDLSPEQQQIAGIPETEAWSLSGLSAPVHVVRTELGVPHIYARNREDLGRVLGFLLARDRYFVMDLQRRLGLGTISELLGDAGLGNDQESRGVGTAFVAERLVANLSPELGAYFDAVADGMNQYVDHVRSGELPPPSELKVVAPLLGASAPADLMKTWDRRDLAAMVAVVLYETTYETGDVGRSGRWAALGKLYAKGEALADLRRSGFLADFAYDVTPLFPDSSAAGFGLELGAGVAPPDGRGASSGRSGKAGSGAGAGASSEGSASKMGLPRARPVPADLIERVSRRLDRFQRKIQRDRIAGFGSNAWAVAGSRSATGAALVAGDGHLQLSVPSLMYQVALDTQLFGGGDEHQIGLLLTGLPVLAVGTNGRVAWSQVNRVLYLTVCYREEIQLDADGRPAASRFRGEWKPLVAVDESYEVADIPALGSKGRTEVWTRWTTFDGRWIADVEGRPAAPDTALGPGEAVVNMQGDLVVPSDTDGDGVITAISFDYAALDATAYVDALDQLAFAEDVWAFREVTRGIVGSGLFSAAGDADGNILYTSYQGVPCRGYLLRNQDGSWAEASDPNLLLDGTEYGGFTLPTKDGKVDEAPGKSDPYACVVPFEEMPQAVSPDQGFVATANNDPGRLTLDGSLTDDTWYLGGPWSSVRVNTIGRELAKVVATGDATVEDMAGIQANADSRMGELFTPPLLAAIEKARALRKSAGPLAAHESRLVDLLVANEAAFDGAFSRLSAWRDAGYITPSGVETFYFSPTESDLKASVATMIFNAYFGRFLRSVWNDEPLGSAWLYSGSRQQVRALRRMLEGRGADNPGKLASWNPGTGEAVFFDRLGTDIVERSEELQLGALADAIGYLQGDPEGAAKGGFGTEDMSGWLWGLRHQARFKSLLASFLGGDPKFGFLVDMFSITTKTLPLAESIPSGDPREGLKWFPRGGDQWSVDAGNPGFSGTDFGHSNGPVMRMVIALKGGKVWGRNIVPGGQSALTDSPHFADQMKLWLANETVPLRFHVEDVVQGAVGREIYRPPSK